MDDLECVTDTVVLLLQSPERGQDAVINSLTTEDHSVERVELPQVVAVEQLHSFIELSVGDVSSLLRHEKVEELRVQRYGVLFVVTTVFILGQEDSESREPPEAFW